MPAINIGPTRARCQRASPRKRRSRLSESHRTTRFPARMPITKSELIDQVAERLQLARARAEQLVDAIFDSMVEALKAGNGIEIRGFGSFTVREYKAYDG